MEFKTITLSIDYFSKKSSDEFNITNEQIINAEWRQIDGEFDAIINGLNYTLYFEELEEFTDGWLRSYWTQTFSLTENQFNLLKLKLK